MRKIITAALVAIVAANADYKNAADSKIDGKGMIELFGEWYAEAPIGLYENRIGEGKQGKKMMIPKVKTNWETVYDIEYNDITECR